MIKNIIQKIYPLNIYIIFLLIFTVLVSSCNISLKKWHTLALKSNKNLYLGCKNNIVNKSEIKTCNEKYTIGKHYINSNAYNEYRIKILNKYINDPKNNLIIYEHYGSGEIAFYYFIVYDINIKTNADLYEIDLSNDTCLESKIILSDSIQYKLNNINDNSYLEYIYNPNLSKKYFASSSYVSISRISKSKLENVTFICNPELYTLIYLD